LDSRSSERVSAFPPRAYTRNPMKIPERDLSSSATAPTAMGSAAAAMVLPQVDCNHRQAISLAAR
jgi:hypothetical protein